ncbi:MAG: hypothetical protein PVS3B2_00450 [Candidatus Dormibacteraceae bacterium]
MTATVNLSPLPKMRFTDSNGNPLVGGKVFTYAAGTTTKQNTYTDASGGTPNANPVLLDSRGEASIWLDQTLAYKVTLSPATDTDPPTSPFWTMDNIAGGGPLSSLTSSANGSGADLVSGVGRVVNSVAAVRALIKTGAGRAFALGYYATNDGGGGQYFYDPSDTTSSDNGGTILVAADGGRWKLVLTGPVSVKQFGAKGDYNGTTGTDDTAAIQACINWVQANTNTGTYGSYSPSVGTGVVYFPQGSYKLTAALTYTTKICILGEGQTEFSYGSRLTQTSANTDLFQVTASAGSTSFSIENMVLRSNAGSGTGHLVNNVRSGGGTVNSQRYVNCTFAQPQAMALMLAGDDIVVKNCLVDVSGQSGNVIQLGTSTMPCTNVRIEGCDFFNVANSCIRLINIAGLTVIGNTMTQPNSSTKTPYFIDGQVTTPTLAQDITVVGNTARGPRTFLGIAGAVNLTVSGNTVGEGGIGTGETFHLLQFGGTSVNVAIVGNTFRGSFYTANFYNDSNCTSITGVISANSFQNDGGAGDALACTKFTGRILSNFFAGFVNRQMGQKLATSGQPVNPGTITAGSTFAFALTVTAATFGDTVDVGTISNAWVAQTGIDVRAFINNTNTVRVEYRNVTGSSITVAAHDLWCEVTR